MSSDCAFNLWERLLRVQSLHLPVAVSYTHLKQMPLHNVTGYDEEYLYAVTAYYPEPDKWENDFKTRRVK